MFRQSTAEQKSLHPMYNDCWCRKLLQFFGQQTHIFSKEPPGATSSVKAKFARTPPSTLWFPLTVACSLLDSAYN